MKLSDIGVKTGLAEIVLQEVCQAAKEASKQAYAPYSKYHVGAGLLTTDGRIFKGCNVENASYGLCLCAERTAIVKAVSDGNKGAFPLMTVYAPDGCGQAAPCGACRQFLVEFNPDMMVIGVPSVGDDYGLWTARELLPAHFGPDSLVEGNSGARCHEERERACH